MQSHTAEDQKQLVKYLIHADEGRKLEFKRVSGKMVGKALETICAFANAEGGHLVLGMGDLKEHQGNARLFGVEEHAEALDELDRKLRTEFLPPLEVRRFHIECTLHNGPAKGRRGRLMVIDVPRSAHVHSLVNGGTFTRLDKSNRTLSAEEITDLSYRRGTRSAVSDPVPIALDRLNTPTWRRFLERRGALSGSMAEQLLSIGLAVQGSDGQVQPLRAAVLLFADEPGSLLAAHGTRADVRVFVYDGKGVVAGAVPNLRKEPKTIRGPLIDQIERTVQTVMDELALGVTLSGSGFRTRHVYPERVVKEAIVNAIVHRDYRLNRDIAVRIFDDHIEIESPGLLPKGITPATVHQAGSKARNDLIAANLRDFPAPPNFDAGEGVKMMFAEMNRAKLYPPLYRENPERAIETLTVHLLNHERPSAWDQVNEWLHRHGVVANADVARMAGVDTLRASKLLIAWRDQGLLVPLPGRAKRNMAYARPETPALEGASGLFAGLTENRSERAGKPR